MAIGPAFQESPHSEVDQNTPAKSPDWEIVDAQRNRPSGDDGDYQSD